MYTSLKTGDKNLIDRITSVSMTRFHSGYT